MQDDHRLRFAFMAYGLQAGIYMAVYFFLISGDGRPFKPWLPIPEAEYYRYNVFFLAPSMLLSWFLGAGAAHLLSKGPCGRFREIFVLSGFGLSLASWATGLHDLISSFLGAIGMIDQQAFEMALNSPTPWRTLLWVLMGIFLAGFILLFSKGVEVVYGFSKTKSAWIGTTAFGVYQFVFFIIVVRQKVRYNLQNDK